tara:strand:+ start:816 stop:980 length:165 start_codon:yes stop_codon:yes gene_type:complete
MIDAETFYLNFKDALNFLGVAWGFKETVEVYIEDTKIVFKHDGKTATIELKKQE